MPKKTPKHKKLRNHQNISPRGWGGGGLMPINFNFLIFTSIFQIFLRVEGATP